VNHHGILQIISQIFIQFWTLLTLVEFDLLYEQSTTTTIDEIQWKVIDPSFYMLIGKHILKDMKGSMESSIFN
jgi:hypothetical protein